MVKKHKHDPLEFTQTYLPPFSNYSCYPKGLTGLAKNTQGVTKIW